MATAELLTHPAFVSAIVPGAVALVVAGALTRAGMLRAVIAFAAAIGVTVGVLLLFGLPSPPVLSALEKLSLLVPLGAVLVVLGTRWLNERWRIVACVGFVMLASLWLAFPRLGRASVWMALILLVIAMGIALGEVPRTPRLPSRLVLAVGVVAVASLVRGRRKL